MDGITISSMERGKRPSKKPQEKDILGRRGAAAAVVLLICGPVFFVLWFRFAVDGAPFGWTWHAPAVATAFCASLAYVMPERMVDFTGHLIGGFFIPPS